jgi:transcriptional regulator with XRE-family HTH domain
MIMLPGSLQRQIGQRIRALRLREGWTQTDLAQRAGVSRPTIERLERGGEITLSRLLRISATLGALESFAELLPVPAPLNIQDLTKRVRIRARRKRNAHS